MDLKMLNNKNVKELHQLLAEKRSELHAYRNKVSEGQLKQVHHVAVARKDVARILTALNTKRKNVVKA